MTLRVDLATTRRRFVQFLAASPLLSHCCTRALAGDTAVPTRLPDPMVWAPRELDNLISDPKEALDVFDFEPVAKKNLPPAHFGYMVTGIDDEVTLRANREGFLKFQLRPRRLVDVSTIDMTTEILGTPFDSPIVIAPTGSNRAFHPEAEVAVAKAARLRRTDAGQCDNCHGNTFRDYVAGKPNFDNIDLTDVTGLNAPNLTWDTVKRLRDIVTTKLVLKGILAREDAKLAADYGIDGIIVSNHSGRVVDSGRATIEVLPEIIEVVGGRMPVLVDSGFRRGTDIIKALAMGAQAVCIGRPYLWGLGAFGQPGVERVLEILRRETRAAMQEVGAPSIKRLTPALVGRA
jgi:isopentenyl diphosphate isomerase/L-lactate dehydrogenase-like FMN-dependent dehydrogenase